MKLLDSNAECIEYETKYRVSDSTLWQFKKIASKFCDKDTDFLYVESEDLYIYDSNKLDEFYRYRYSNNTTERRSEFTYKKKLQTNNIKRKEYNFRLDMQYPNKSDVVNYTKDKGYDRTFTVFKACHIYKVKDATLVFYTVNLDNDPAAYHFVEIEIDESLEITESRAAELIDLYEAKLAPIGVNKRNRESRSLFEIFNPDALDRPVA